MAILLMAVTRDLLRVDFVTEEAEAKSIIDGLLGVDSSPVNDPNTAAANDFVVDIPDEALTFLPDWVNYGIVDFGIETVGRVTATTYQEV